MSASGPAQSATQMLMQDTLAKFIQSTRNYLLHGIHINWKSQSLQSLNSYLEKEFASIETMRTLIIYSRTNQDQVVWFLLQWRMHALSQYNVLLQEDHDGQANSSAFHMLSKTSGGLLRSKVIYACLVDFIVGKSLVFILGALLDDVNDALVATTPDVAIQNIIENGGSTCDFLIASQGGVPNVGRLGKLSTNSSQVHHNIEYLNVLREITAENKSFDSKIKLRLRQKEISRIESLVAITLCANTSKAHAMPQKGLFTNESAYKLGIHLHNQVQTVWGHVSYVISSAVCLINTDQSSTASSVVVNAAAERTRRQYVQKSLQPSAFIAPNMTDSLNADITYGHMQVALDKQIYENSMLLQTAVEGGRALGNTFQMQGVTPSQFGFQTAQGQNINNALCLTAARAEQVKLGSTQEQNYLHMLSDTAILHTHQKDQPDVATAFSSGQVKLVYGYTLIEIMDSAGKSADNEMLHRICRALGYLNLDLSCVNNIAFVSSLLHKIAQLMELKWMKERELMQCLCFALSNALWNVYDKRWCVDLDYGRLGIALNKLLTLIEKHAQDTNDYDSGLPAYTACVCALPKHNFLMKFEGAQTFILRCMGLKEKDNGYQRRIKVMALRCAQRILLVYYSRVYESGAESFCDISKFIAADVVAAATQQSGLQSNNTNANTEELYNPMFPLHAQWISSSSELENTFLSVVLTIACHDPVLALRAMIVPLLRPVSSSIASNTNSAVYTQVGENHEEFDDLAVYTSEASSYSSKGRKLDMDGQFQTGGAAVGVMLALRSLAIVIAGKLALSPISYPASLTFDNNQCVSVLRHVQSQHQQQHELLLRKLKLTSETMKNQSDYMDQGTSIVQQLDELACTKWGKQDQFESPINFNWAPTSSILASLLSQLPNLSMDQVMLKMHSTENGILASSLSNVFSRCVEHTGQARFANYIPNTSEKFLLRYKHTITTLTLLLRCFCYTWPKDMTMLEVVTTVIKLLTHLNRSVREGASRVLSSMLFTVEDTVKRSTVVNTLSAQLLQAQTSVCTVPQKLTASLVALEYELENGDAGILDQAIEDSTYTSQVADRLYIKASMHEVSRVIENQDKSNALVLVAQTTYLDPLLQTPKLSQTSKMFEQPYNLPNNFINLEANNNNMSVEAYRAYRTSLENAMSSQQHGFPRDETWSLVQIASVTAVSRLEPRNDTLAQTGVDILLGNLPSERGVEESLLLSWHQHRALQVLHIDTQALTRECTEVSTNNYFSRLYTAITDRHTTLIDTLNTLIEQDVMKNAYGYNNGSNVNMHNNFDAYTQYLVSIRDQQQHNMHSNHNGMQIGSHNHPNHTSTVEHGGALLNRNTQHGYSYERQPLVLPSREELRLEALLVWLYHMAARVTRIETLLSTLSYLDWNSIEASGIACISSNSVGVRQLGLKVLHILHNVSNTHLQLIHALDYIYKKRAEVIHYVNIMYYGGNDKVKAMLSNSYDVYHENITLLLNNVIDLTQETDTITDEEGSMIHKKENKNNKDDTEGFYEEQECEEAKEVLIEEDGTEVHIVTKTTVHVTQKTHRIAAVRRASGVCLNEEGGFDLATVTMDVQPEETMSPAIVEEEEEEEVVYVEYQTTNVSGVDIKDGSNTYKVKIDHGPLGEVVRKEAVHAGNSILERKKGAVLKTAAYTLPFASNSGHTTTHDGYAKDGTATVTSGFFPPKKHFLSCVTELRGEIQLFLTARKETVSAGTKRSSQVHGVTNDLLSSLRIFVMETKEDAQKVAEELDTCQILHSTHTLDVDGLELFAKLLSAKTMHGFSVYADVLGFVSRKYLHNNLFQQAMLQLQQYSRGVYTDQCTRRKLDTACLNNTHGVMSYDFEAPISSSSDDNTVSVPLAGSTEGVILGDGDKHTQYSRKVIKMYDDKQCNSYYVSTSSKLYSFASPQPLETIHALLPVLQRNIHTLNKNPKYHLQCENTTNQVATLLEPYYSAKDVPISNTSKTSERVDRDKAYTVEALSLWTRLQYVLGAVFCIVDTKLPLQPRNLKLALDYFTQHSNKTDTHVKQSINAMLGVQVNPSIFADQLHIFTDLTAKMVCTCIQHRSMAALALSNASVLAHHLVLHNLASLELSIYEPKVKTVLCSLPPVARNIHGVYCSKSCCDKEPTGVTNPDCSGAGHHSTQPIEQYISPEDIIYDDERTQMTGISKKSVNATQFAHYISHTLRVTNTEEVIFTPNRTYRTVFADAAKFDSRTLVYTTPWTQLSKHLKSTFQSKRSKLGPQCILLRITLLQFYNNWLRNTHTEVMSTMYHGKVRALAAMHDAMAYFQNHEKDKELDLATLRLREEFSKLVQRVSILEGEYLGDLNTYYSTINSTYHYFQIGAPTVEYTHASQQKQEYFRHDDAKEDCYTSDQKNTNVEPGLFRHPVIRSTAELTETVPLAWSNYVRRTLFQTMFYWTGLIVSKDVERQQKTTSIFQAANIPNAADKYTLLVERSKMHAIRSMTCLLYGPYFDPLLLPSLQSLSKYKDESSVYAFLRQCLCSFNPETIAYGSMSVFLLLSSNTPQLYAFINHCYHSNELVKSRFFVAVTRVVLTGYVKALQETKVVDSSLFLNPVFGYAYNSGIEGYTPVNGTKQTKESSSILPIHLFTHLVIFKLADSNFSIRSLALRVLPLLEIHIRAITKSQVHRQAVLLGYDVDMFHPSTTEDVVFDVVDGIMASSNQYGVDLAWEKKQLQRYLHGECLYDVEHESYEFFSEHAQEYIASAGSAVSITSHLPESYMNVQQTWSNRLAVQFPMLALPFLQEAFARLLLIHKGAEIRNILVYVLPWLQRIVLTSSIHPLPVPLPESQQWNSVKANRAEKLSPYYVFSGSGPHTYGMGNGSGNAVGLEHTCILGPLQSQSLLWSMYHAGLHGYKQSNSHVEALWSSLFSWMYTHPHVVGVKAYTSENMKQISQYLNISVTLDFLTYCVPSACNYHVPRSAIHMCKTIAVNALRVTPLHTLHHMVSIIGPKQLHDMGDNFSTNSTWAHDLPPIAHIQAQRVDTTTMYSANVNTTLTPEQIKLMPSAPTSVHLFLTEEERFTVFSAHVPVEDFFTKGDAGAAALNNRDVQTVSSDILTNSTLDTPLYKLPFSSTPGNSTGAHRLDQFTERIANVSQLFQVGRDFQLSPAGLSLMMLADCCYEQTQTSKDQKWQESSIVIYAIPKLQDLLVSQFHLGCIGILPSNSQFTRSHCAVLLVNLSHSISLIPVNNNVQNEPSTIDATSQEYLTNISIAQIDTQAICELVSDCLDLVDEEYSSCVHNPQFFNSTLVNCTNSDNVDPLLAVSGAEKKKGALFQLVSLCSDMLLRLFSCWKPQEVWAYWAAQWARASFRIPMRLASLDILRCLNVFSHNINTQSILLEILSLHLVPRNTLQVLIQQVHADVYSGDTQKACIESTRDLHSVRRCDTDQFIHDSQGHGLYDHLLLRVKEDITTSYTHDLQLPSTSAVVMNLQKCESIIQAVWSAVGGVVDINTQIFQAHKHIIPEDSYACLNLHWSVLEHLTTAIQHNTSSVSASILEPLARLACTHTSPMEWATLFESNSNNPEIALILQNMTSLRQAFWLSVGLLRIDEMQADTIETYSVPHTTGVYSNSYLPALKLLLSIQNTPVFACHSNSAPFTKDHIQAFCHYVQWYVCVPPTYVTDTSPLPDVFVDTYNYKEDVIKTTSYMACVLATGYTSMHRALPYIHQPYSIGNVTKFPGLHRILLRGVLCHQAEVRTLATLAMSTLWCSAAPVLSIAEISTIPEVKYRIVNSHTMPVFTDSCECGECNEIYCITTSSVKNQQSKHSPALALSGSMVLLQELLANQDNIACIFSEDIICLAAKLHDPDVSALASRGTQLAYGRYKPSAHLSTKQTYLPFFTHVLSSIVETNDTVDTKVYDIIHRIFGLPILGQDDVPGKVALRPLEIVASAPTLTHAIILSMSLALAAKASQLAHRIGAIDVGIALSDLVMGRRFLTTYKTTTDWTYSQRVVHAHDKNIKRMNKGIWGDGMMKYHSFDNPLFEAVQHKPLDQTEKLNKPVSHTFVEIPTVLIPITRNESITNSIQSVNWNLTPLVPTQLLALTAEHSNADMRDFSKVIAALWATSLAERAKLNGGTLEEQEHEWLYHIAFLELFTTVQQHAHTNIHGMWGSAVPVAEELRENMHQFQEIAQSTTINVQLRTKMNNKNLDSAVVPYGMHTLHMQELRMSSSNPTIVQNNIKQYILRMLINMRKSSMETTWTNLMLLIARCPPQFQLVDDVWGSIALRIRRGLSSHAYLHADRILSISFLRNTDASRLQLCQSVYDKTAAQSWSELDDLQYAKLQKYKNDKKSQPKWATNCNEQVEHAKKGESLYPTYEQAWVGAYTLQGENTFGQQDNEDLVLETNVLGWKEEVITVDFTSVEKDTMLYTSHSTADDAEEDDYDSMDDCDMSLIPQLPPRSPTYSEKHPMPVISQPTNTIVLRPRDFMPLPPVASSKLTSIRQKQLTFQANLYDVVEDMEKTMDDLCIEHNVEVQYVDSNHDRDTKDKDSIIETPKKVISSTITTTTTSTTSTSSNNTPIITNLKNNRKSTIVKPTSTNTSRPSSVRKSTITSSMNNSNIPRQSLVSRQSTVTATPRKSSQLLQSPPKITPRTQIIQERRESLTTPPTSPQVVKKQTVVTTTNKPKLAATRKLPTKQSFSPSDSGSAPSFEEL